jgi:adenosylmethionine-8-amino-7-oxononanoate aminotransferase
MKSFLMNSNIICPETGKDYPRISYGKGPYLYDETGKRYIDGSSGTVAANLGHAIPEAIAVLEEQARKIALHPHCFTSTVLEEYVERLVNFSPFDSGKAWTITSGTEAVENALKIAVQYQQLRGEQGRYKILGRWGSYHGNSIFALDVGGMVIRRAVFQPLLRDFPHLPRAYCYRCPFGETVDQCDLQCARTVEDIILREDPGTVAAIILEPVVGAALGAVPAPEGYFEIIRDLCDKYGIVLIADEVMTGFGRTGNNFGIDQWGVVPDIIAVGKGMGCGYYPLSGVIVNQNIVEVFEDKRTPFMGGHTYACNPMGAAIGHFVLDYLKEHDLITRVKRTGARFFKKLQTLRALDLVGDVRSAGFLFGVELVMDQSSTTPFPASLEISKKVVEKAQQKGLIIYPGKGSCDGQRGDHILIAPPLNVEEDVLDMIFKIVEESLVEVVEGVRVKSSQTKNTFRII